MIPTPLSVRQGQGSFALADARAFSVGDAALLPLAEDFRQTLRQLIGVELPESVVEPGASTPGVRVEFGPADVPLPGGRRADDGDPRCEAYALSADHDGVLVRAEHAEGIHRGLTSLIHLAPAVPYGQILDAPRFAWRGLSLDVARTFVPTGELERVIDMLSLYKMNVLHLHLTDDQGWRLEIKSWPRLTEIGAAGAYGERPGGFYTREEFRALVAYARERFVTIVPEIDMPGHVGAVLAAYPELAQEPGSPYASLDPGNELVWQFVRDVLTEVADLTDGAYLHLGGDEAFGMTDADHARFVSRAVRQARELGKKVIGWQELVRGDVGPEEIIQYWIDFAAQADAHQADAELPAEADAFLMQMFAKASGDLPKAAAKGTGVLLSPNAHTYLDRPHGEASTLAAQEATRGRLGLQAYPATTLQALADWEPLEAVPEIDPAAVVGVEAALWCETVEDTDDLEQLLLPRLPGIAEAGWSTVRLDWDLHRLRLAEQASMWQRAGWTWYHADSVDWPTEL